MIAVSLTGVFKEIVSHVQLLHRKSYWLFIITTPNPVYSDIESSSRSNPSTPDARNPPHPRRLRNNPTSVSSSRPGASRPAHNLPYSNLYTRYVFFRLKSIVSLDSLVGCLSLCPYFPLYGSSSQMSSSTLL